MNHALTPVQFDCGAIPPLPAELRNLWLRAPAVVTADFGLVASGLLARLAEWLPGGR